jgi:hypothetical protein
MDSHGGHPVGWPLRGKIMLKGINFFADAGKNRWSVWPEGRVLPGAHDPPYRLNQFVRIVADAVFEYDVDILDIINVL